MKNKLMRALICALGVLLVMGFISLVFNFVPNTAPLGVRLAVTVGVLALSLFVFFLASGPIVRMIAAMAQKVDKVLGRVQMGDLCFACVGAALGLWVASMLSMLLRDLPYPLFLALSAVIYVCVAFLFGNTARKRWRELPFFADGKHADKNLGQLRASVQGAEESAARDAVSAYKLLDSSALIDGRILPVCATGFLEGTFIAPQFILRELQTLADSADADKRRKGRRGLEVLEQLGKTGQIRLIAGQYDDAGAQDCDVKLLKLAKRLGAAIVTTDYNLNKVASVSGIPVLNLNELSNAVRQLPLQGDTLSVRVQKPGRDPTQGVGYLEDGTMIVVEGGRGHVGQTIDTVVTGVLQTAAGRMVFTRPKETA